MAKPITTSPIPLRRAIDPNELYRTDPCDVSHVLGSFWPNSRQSFESHLVKTFKACNPVKDFEPHISALCRFYVSLIIEQIKGEKVDWIARVLSSSETEVDNSRPQSLLVDMLCAMMGARNASDTFFKSQSRPPMRGVKRLAGSEALRARIGYVTQDLFIRPRRLGGCVLLVDDICNTGASVRVYAQALKEFAEVEKVCAVNLAATRFAGGKDGYGMLKLDVASLKDYSSLGQVWVDKNRILHATEECGSIEKPTTCEVKFAAEREASPCPICIGSAPAKRKWWQIWG